MKSATILIIAAVLAAASAPSAGLGTTVVHSPLLNIAQGVLLEGDLDKYPDLIGGLCSVPFVGISNIYLTVEGALPGDRVVLWTVEEDEFRRWSWVAHPAEGTPPAVSARTFAGYAGCPDFRVEGQVVEGVVGYTVVACHAVRLCPDALTPA